MIPAAQNPIASHPCPFFISSEVRGIVAIERGVMMKTRRRTPGIVNVLPKINTCQKVCH